MTAARHRGPAVRVARYALGAAYAAAFAYSYVHRGFPFDRLQVLLWVTGALLIAGVGRGWPWSARIILDWIPFALLLYAYDYTQDLAKGAGRHITVAPLVRADRLLFFGSVPTVWVQHHIAHNGGVRWWELGVSIVYASHFVVPFVLAGVLWWRSRRLWIEWATRFLTVSFAAVIVFAAVPTGAPWFASYEGLIPPVDRPVGRGWVKIGLHSAPALIERGRGLVNPYAALPSLHAGYSMLVALFVYRLIGAGRWRRLVFAYPAAMAFVLVYGGEHFMVDLLAGWALTAAVDLGWRARERRRRSRAGPLDTTARELAVLAGE